MKTEKRPYTRVKKYTAKDGTVTYNTYYQITLPLNKTTGPLFCRLKEEGWDHVAAFGLLVNQEALKTLPELGIVKDTLTKSTKEK